MEKRVGFVCERFYERDVALVVVSTVGSVRIDALFILMNTLLDHPIQVY